MINPLEFSEREEVISMSLSKLRDCQKSFYKEIKKYMEFGMQTYQLKKELSCQ